MFLTKNKEKKKKKLNKEKFFLKKTSFFFLYFKKRILTINLGTIVRGNFIYDIRNIYSSKIFKEFLWKLEKKGFVFH